MSLNIETYMENFYTSTASIKKHFSKLDKSSVIQYRKYIQQEVQPIWLLAKWVPIEETISIRSRVWTNRIKSWRRPCWKKRCLKTKKNKKYHKTYRKMQSMKRQTKMSYFDHRSTRKSKLCGSRYITNKWDMTLHSKHCNSLLLNKAHKTKKITS